MLNSASRMQAGGMQAGLPGPELTRAVLGVRRSTGLGGSMHGGGAGGDLLEPPPPAWGEMEMDGRLSQDMGG